MTKRAKRFRKKLMGTGVGRNAANYLIQRRSAVDMAAVAQIVNMPGFINITGVANHIRIARIYGTRFVTSFRIKRFVEE